MAWSWLGLSRRVNYRISADTYNRQVVHHAQVDVAQTNCIGAKCPGLSGTITEMDGKKLSRTDSNNVIDLSRFGKKYYSKRCLPRKRVEVLLHLLLRKQSEIVTTTIPGPPGSREFVGARRGLHTLVVLCASQTLRFLNDIHDESIVGGAYGRGLSRIFVLESWHLCNCMDL